MAIEGLTPFTGLASLVSGFHRMRSWAAQSEPETLVRGLVLLATFALTAAGSALTASAQEPGLPIEPGALTAEFAEVRETPGRSLIFRREPFETVFFEAVPESIAGAITPGKQTVSADILVQEIPTRPAADYAPPNTIYNVTAGATAAVAAVVAALLAFRWRMRDRLGVVVVAAIGGFLGFLLADALVAGRLYFHPLYIDNATGNDRHVEIDSHLSFDLSARSHARVGLRRGPHVVRVSSADVPVRIYNLNINPRGPKGMFILNLGRGNTYEIAHATYSSDATRQ
jgi:hypothetical protein